MVGSLPAARLYVLAGSVAAGLLGTVFALVLFLSERLGGSGPWSNDEVHVGQKGRVTFMQQDGTSESLRPP